MVRLALGLAVPGLFLALLEAGLRLSGYGYPTQFFLRSADGRHYEPNRKFTRQFYPRETATQPHPFLMPAEKAAGALRIFVLGESAAAGTPDPAFGFARILEVMLRQQYPDKRIEIVNAAMRGINSHIILPIATECAQFQPDLFLLYLGNNEATGLYAPEPRGLNLTPYLRLLRLGQKLKRTKTGQLLAAGVAVFRGGGSSRSKQDMDFFRRHRLAADDPKRQAVYANFQANLEDICQAVVKARAKVIVATVAVNLKDFPPVASLHRQGLTQSEQARWERAYAAGVAAEKAGQWEKALEKFLEATRLDPHFADLQFRLGRCYFGSGQFDRAREHFRLARDWDALQFRTDTRLNEIARGLASDQAARGIYLLDIERAFAESPLSEQGIPGGKLFHEHVHFTFDGDYLLAQSFLPAVSAALGLGIPQAPVPCRQECAEALAFTVWDEVNVATAMVELNSRPPFRDQIDHAERQARAQADLNARRTQLRPEEINRALDIYRQVIGRRPEDWQVRYNFANLLLELGQFQAAIPQFETVIARFPNLHWMRMGLGNALARAGRWDGAIAQFEQALRIEPVYPPAKAALDYARSQMAAPGRR